MKKFAVRCSAMALLGVAMAAFSAGNSSAANLADEPTIKEIMHKLYDKGAIKDKIAGDLKAKEPNWDDLSAAVKELVPLAKALGKNKQPKGPDESWMKLTDGYAKAAVDLEKAAADKDAKAANTAFKVILGCASCHPAHRPKK
jgi:hypothetical protein